ncbi:MAG: patatin-like phospholipase family protein [archaeon]
MKEDNKEKPKIGLALSGGGSRAIAFHLGCLKALKKLRILQDIDVISGVSGGSVIAALYAYDNDEFDNFEVKIKELLKSGLQWGIFFELIRFRAILIIFNFLLYAFVGIITSILKLLVVILSKVFQSHAPRWTNIFNISIPRKYNRLNAFESLLDKKYFGGKKLTSETRNGISVVINSCELRTGTAMRFGNKESGCWRFGKILNNDVKVATAVSSSAAFPILLPALDRRWELVDRAGNVKTERLLLTDGGVYDNLGISCMEPGKSADYSFNANPCNYIICCNAGQGQFDGNAFPGWWATRMQRAFLSVFRKVQDGFADKLHNYKKNNQIRDFVYSYLGQQDERLPNRPENFVTRDKVYEYPTDFSSMEENDMDLLILRGEQLMTILVNEYCPELINKNTGLSNSKIELTTLK